MHKDVTPVTNPAKKAMTKLPNKLWNWLGRKEDKSFTVGSCIREKLPNKEKHVAAKYLLGSFSLIGQQGILLSLYLYV
jgi:hypothetical protein